MPCTASDVLQIFSGIFSQRFITEGKTVEADYGIHRSADLMAHAGQERGLCFVRLLCCFQSFSESLILFQSIAHFFVDYRKSQTYRVNCVVVTLFRMALACHTDHLVVFFSVSLREIAVYDQEILG